MTSEAELFGKDSVKLNMRIQGLHLADTPQRQQNADPWKI